MPAAARRPAADTSEPGGDISLDFADTDIREVVAQILGTLLHVNYTIDPAVHGTATLHTVNPSPRSRLLPTLQALLAQNGATVVQIGGSTACCRPPTPPRPPAWPPAAPRGGARDAAALRLGRRPRQGAAALRRRHRPRSPPTPAATPC